MAEDREDTGNVTKSRYGMQDHGYVRFVILHPVSCILYPVSCIRYPESCILNQIKSSIN